MRSGPRFKQTGWKEYIRKKENNKNDWKEEKWAEKKYRQTIDGCIFLYSLRKSSTALFRIWFSPFFLFCFFCILYFVVERSFRPLKAYCCYPLFASLECLFVRSRKSFIANHIWISIYFVGFFFSRCIRQPALGTREAIHHQQCTMHPLQTYAHTHSDASQPIKIVSINPVTLIGSRLSNTISNPIDKTL